MTTHALTAGVFLLLLCDSRTAAALSAAPTDAAGNTLLSCNFGDNAFRGMHFADLMKQALPFGQPDLPASQNASVDAAGWPTQDFSVSVYSEGVTKASYSWPPARIGGVYTITAHGNATLRFPANATIGTILNQTYDAAANLFVAYVSVPDDPATNGGRLEFAFVGTVRDPARPGALGMTNVSVLQPGYAIGTDPDTFTPESLATYAPCKGAIRVMPWWLAESRSASTVTSGSWSKRTRVGVPSYLLGEYGTLGPGAPWEVMVGYVNALGASIWANVPPGTLNELNETARDEYTLNLVTLLHKSLPPDKVIYLEFGNELWNGAFEGNWVVNAIANASVLFGGDPYQLNYGLPTPPSVKNCPIWASRYVAWMAKHMGDIAATVVGASRVGRADLPGVRVVPILGAQGGYPPSAIGQLDYLINVWGMPSFVGTVATDGYTDFGSPDANFTGNEIIERFTQKIAAMSPSAGQPAPTWFCNPWSNWAALAAYYGVFLHAYEGSPIHTGQLSMEGLSEAYQDPRFAGIVSSTIALWQTWHGGAYNWFTGGAETLFCPWGSNAVTWDMREPATPKMAGIVAVASTPPAPVTSGLPLPLVNHPWSDYIGSYTPNCSVSPPRSPYPQSIGANRSISYLLYVPDPTTCRLKVSLAMCGRGSAAGTSFMRFSIAAWMAPIDFPAPQSPAGCSQYAPVERTFPPLSGPRFTGNPHITLVFTNVYQPGTYEMTTFNASCA